MQAHYVGTREFAKNELQEIFKTRPSDFRILLTGRNWISRTKESTELLHWGDKIKEIVAYTNK